MRRSLPWLAAIALCVACRKPPPDERVFTGSNGVRPGVTNDDASNGAAPMSGAGGTSSGGTSEYGAAHAQPLAAIRCEPAASDRQDALGDAMLELLDVLEDPALAAATSSEPALSRVRQSSRVFRERLESCDDAWLRQVGASDVADRLRARLTALDDALRAAPGSVDVGAAVRALGDELESGAIHVLDLELPAARDAR
ncbi:MAG: hypothetical protein ABW217_18885 [Polyangiaceae bacterium]